MKPENHTLLRLLAALPAFLLIGSLQARTDIEENRPISPDGRVQIDNMAGSVDVSAWDKPEVEIRGYLGDQVDELEITETSGGLRIRVHNQSNQRRVDESELRLKVPAGVSIEAEGISADVNIEGLDNSSVIVSTVSGDVDVSAKTQQLEVESVSGDVKFHGHASRVGVESVSGEIEIEGVEGELRLTTVSGDLNLKGGMVSLGRFETVSGDLELSLEVADNGRVSADSMSGDVTLDLPGSQQAEFTAETYSGDIRTDFGTVDKDKSRHGRSLRHTEGNNGASISVESFSGDAYLRKR